MTKPATKLDKIHYYLEDAGYIPMAIISFDDAHNPVNLICSTPNHQHVLAWNASAWAISSNLATILGREKRGHQPDSPDAVCPYCPTRNTETKE